MHAESSYIRRTKSPVCTCEECLAWDAPRRKAQPGKHGMPVAWRGRWYHRMAKGHYRHAKGNLLHRAIWELHRGPIPDGYHVHHEDEDPGNNQPWNLELLSPAEHVAKHEPRGFRIFSYAERSVNAKETWARRGHIEFKCLQCGRFGTTRSQRRRQFCNKNCGRRYKTAMAIKERDCATCGIVFSSSDQRQIYCSSQCNDRAYYRRRKRL